MCPHVLRASSKALQVHGLSLVGFGGDSKGVRKLGDEVASFFLCFQLSHFVGVHHIAMVSAPDASGTRQRLCSETKS